MTMNVPGTPRKAKRTAATPTAAAMPPPMLHARWLTLQLLLGHNNDDIRIACKNHDLPSPTNEVLNRMRAGLHPPKGFRAGSRTHKASIEFVKGLGLDAFVVRTDEADQALTLLQTPRARELAEAGLVLGVPPEAIVRMVGTHMRLEVTEAALKTYAAVFFDVAAVTRSQLKVLVHARVREAVLRVVGGNDDAPAARRAVASDARTIAVSLAASPAGWAAALLAMGIVPKRHDLSRVLSELEEVAATRAAQALLRGGPHDERRAEGFVSVLRNLREISETVAAPQADLANRLRVHLVTDRTVPVGIHELRARGDEVSTGPSEVAISAAYVGGAGADELTVGAADDDAGD